MEPKLKVEFAPGCFDDFDGTEEELQELVAWVRQIAADGSILEMSELLSDEEADEIWEMVQKRSSSRQ